MSSGHRQRRNQGFRVLILGFAIDSLCDVSNTKYCQLCNVHLFYIPSGLNNNLFLNAIALFVRKKATSLLGKRTTFLICFQSPVLYNHLFHTQSRRTHFDAFITIVFAPPSLTVLLLVTQTLSAGF